MLVTEDAMAKLVSILIPSYNAQEWIEETIRSALAQTWPQKEIIVVDDGSSDDSLKIARQYQSKTLKVVSQENRGGAEARNTALSHAQGDYIQWLDADDLLAPDKIERQLSAMDEGDNSRILLTSAWAPFYYRTTRAKFRPDSLWRDLDPVEWIITKFSENLFMNPAVWLVSRKLADLAGPWDRRTAPDDDGEYLCRIMINSEKVKFVPEARSYYRKSNPKSLSRGLSSNALEGIFLSKKLCIGYLLSIEDSERTRRACLTLLQRGLGRIHPEHPAIVQKACGLANALGGELSLPKIDWKYAAVRRLFGPKTATKAKQLKVRIEEAVARNWDRWLSAFPGN